MQPDRQHKVQVAPGLPLQNLKILLVEDELDVADLLVFILETAGSTVRTCLDAETALGVLERFDPDVLVSNIKLPLHDGFWLIQQIRNHTRLDIQRLPAIAVTSYTREVDQAQTSAAGFDFFLTKIDDSDLIVDVISALLNS